MWRITFLILLLTWMIPGDEKTMSNPFDGLPSEINGWRHREEAALYTPDTLFEYINGGAELYISYGFVRLWAHKYARPNHPEISLDIFDMGHSHRAFGVYSHGRETDDRIMGQGGEYAGGLLTFWQDRYYVSILIYPESESGREAVFKLGRAVAAAAGGGGATPPILNELPAENLIPESRRYILHHAWINGFYFISDQNILNINTETEAVLAKYTSSLVLLLVSYPDAAAAEEAHRKFTAAFLPEAPSGIAKLEDDRWTCCRREGKRIWVVLNGADREAVTTMLDLALRNQ